MQVEEPGPLHFETDAGGLIVLLSEDLAKTFVEIRAYLKVNLPVNLALEEDILPDIVDRLVSLLTVDLGSFSATLTLATFALAELCDRLQVKGYKVSRTPAVLGKAVIGKTRYGQSGYEIEATGLPD